LAEAVDPGGVLALLSLTSAVHLGSLDEYVPLSSAPADRCISKPEGTSLSPIRADLTSRTVRRLTGTVVGFVVGFVVGVADVVGLAVLEVCGFATGEPDPPPHADNPTTTVPTVAIQSRGRYSNGLVLT